MRSKQADKEFQRYLDSRGTGFVTPAAGFDALFAFYRDVRADDAIAEEQGDMLLYQWGVYDFGEGARFELDLTRQLVAANAEDEDIWQLHLTYRFEPSQELQALGEGNKWCESPDQLDDFTTFIKTHPAFTATARRSDGNIDIRYEQAG